MLSRFSKFHESTQGELYSYRKRLCRRVHLHVQTELESKKAAKTLSRVFFQKEIARQMVELRRLRPYRVPVAIQMDFNAGITNPPAVHTLAKHYLDLLQQPDPSFALGRNRLLVQDDRLVKVLICSYGLSDFGPQGIGIRIATMTYFITDLELFGRVIRGEFDAGLRRSPRVTHYCLVKVTHHREQHLEQDLE